MYDVHIAAVGYKLIIFCIISPSAKQYAGIKYVMIIFNYILKAMSLQKTF